LPVGDGNFEINFASIRINSSLRCLKSVTNTSSKLDPSLNFKIGSKLSFSPGLAVKT